MTPYPISGPIKLGEATGRSYHEGHGLSSTSTGEQPQSGSQLPTVWTETIATSTVWVPKTCAWAECPGECGCPGGWVEGLVRAGAG